MNVAFYPYKDRGGYEPWDWDGNVPAWLQSDLAELAVELIGYGVTGVEGWGDAYDYLVEQVDTYAPDLLDQTVPPDPWMVLSQGGEVLDVTATADDTYAPGWSGFVFVTADGHDLLMEFTDEDLAFDDEMQVVTMDRSEMEVAAGRGPVTYTQLGTVFALEVEVEPVW